jgi:Ser/Thr protein kinase RdoA (MazF antagonist)
MPEQSTQTTIKRMLTTSAPAFSGDQAAALALEYFGIRATTHPLVSERDQNFRLDANDGQHFTLKISNHAEQEGVVDFQNQALSHIASTDPALPVPRVIPGHDGCLHYRIEHAGNHHLVRVLSWVEGRVVDNTETGPGLVSGLGRLLARLGLALRDFDHPGSNPPSLWDMKRAAGLRALLDSIETQELRDLAGQVLDGFDTRISPVLDRLRTQVIYSDMHLDNVLVDESHPDRISGLIDFGDLVKSPLIMDLAIACAYQLSNSDDPLNGALPMIAGYHAVNPLQELEQRLLPDLIKTRLVTSLLIGSYRATLFPDNREYLLTSFTAARQALARLSHKRADEAVRRINETCKAAAR